MRKTKHILCILIFLFLLCACSYVGDSNFAIFQEQFNKADKEIQLDNSNIIVEENDDKTKYNCFFNAGKNSDYLITIYQKNDVNIISSCTLCILKSNELNLSYIEDLFCSMLYGYNLTEKDKAKEIFKKLSLDNKTTYLANRKMEEEFENLKFIITVNGVGISITIK